MAVFKNVEAALDYGIALQADPGHALLASRVRTGIHIGPVTVTVDDIHGDSVNFAARVGGATKAPETWLSEDALRHLVAYRASRHEDLRWQDHPEVTLKGLPGSYRLWSVATTGRTLPEIAASGCLVPAGATATPPVAISNIPEGMVPRHFLGRDEALSDIAAALEGGGGRVAITALHGLRGVGKTVLAAAYAEQHRADYRATWWIRAETESGLRADLVGLGVALGWVVPEEKEEPALVALRERLQHEGHGLLLIFDNARDASTVRPWLPRGAASRTIVTSNAPAWGAVATPVAIRVWPKETGADFLIARTGRQGERAAAKALSAALGGLPLAHEMAGSYCERIGMSFAEYRRRFDAEPARLLDSGKDAPAEYHDRLTVAKTFALAIDEAAKVHPAAELLIVLAALLAPEPIPLFLFREGFADRFAGPGLDEAVAALRAFALVDCEAITDERNPTVTTDTMRLHRLVREVAGARIDPQLSEAARRALIVAVDTVYPGDVFDNPNSWPRARRLDAVALGLVGGYTGLPKQAEISASNLMTGLAAYRRSALGAYLSAQPLCERALTLVEKELGPEDPITAQRLSNLALLLEELQDPAAAQPLCERALAIRTKALGPDHPSTANSLNNLALLLLKQGDFASARPLLEQALAICERVLGSEHRHTATSLSNLASTFRGLEDLPIARSLNERALAIREKVLSPKHPDTATSLRNLAFLLCRQGDPRTARPLGERALAICEEVLGSEHPDTLLSMGNLAAICHAQGDVVEARCLLARALPIMEETLGSQHPETVAVRKRLRNWPESDE
jgi:tetratricopeptide (TPR) repeat protein